MLHLACKGGATFVLTSQLSAADHLRSLNLDRETKKGPGWSRVFLAKEEVAVGVVGATAFFT